MKRFWSKVEKSDSCWNWVAAKYRGYGAYWDGKKVQRAHRVSWEMANGSIPTGMCILHKCDNPSCVNPDHLDIGTQKENMADRDRKGRVARGENHYAAKINREQAKVIKRNRGLIQGKELARMFGISPQLVSHIQTGKAWRVV